MLGYGIDRDDDVGICYLGFANGAIPWGGEGSLHGCRKSAPGEPQRAGLRGCLKTLPFTLSLSKGRGTVHGSTSSPRTVSDDLLDTPETRYCEGTPRGDLCVTFRLAGE